MLEIIIVIIATIICATIFFLVEHKEEIWEELYNTKEK